MRQTRSRTKRASPVAKSSSENDEPQNKRPNNTNTHYELKLSEESSSDSDIDTYLKPVKEIDLNSSFFKTKPEKTTFQHIEKDILSGIDRLSDSDSKDDPSGQSDIVKCESASTSNTCNNEQYSKINIINFEKYNRKLEEAKKQIEVYEAKKNIRANEDNILDMLTARESKSSTKNVFENSVSSRDYESSSDDEENWSEIKNSQENILIPKKGIEITVDLPSNARKKKGVDLMDIVKRRLNKRKKETQVYIHKVHLLCWIAHGNYLNKILTSENLMGLTLSLLPSQKCYPSHLVNMAYLEEITQWYRKQITIKEDTLNDELISEEILEKQIVQKQAHSSKMFVYIFICLLRSLGIKCRLMLSLQVEPIRPTNDELCSLKKVTSKRNSIATAISNSKTDDTVKLTPQSSKSQPVTTKVVSSKRVSHFQRKNKNLKKVRFEDSCLVDTDEKSVSQTSSSLKSKLSTVRCLQDQKSEITKRTDTSKRKNKRGTSEKKDLESKEEGNNKVSAEKSISGTPLQCDEASSKQKRNRNEKCKKYDERAEATHNSINISNSGPKSLSNRSIKEHEHSQSGRKNVSNVKDGTRTNIKEKLQITKRSQRLPNSSKSKKQETVHDLKQQSNFPKLSNLKNKDSASNCTEGHKKIQHKDNTTNLSSFKVKMPFKLKCTSVQEDPEKSSANNLNAAQNKGHSIPQLDGGNDDVENSKTKSKVNLKRLKSESLSKCTAKAHPPRLKNENQAEGTDSDEEFHYEPTRARRNMVRQKENAGKSCTSNGRPVSKNSKGVIDVRRDIIDLVGQTLPKKLPRVRSNKQERTSETSDSDYMPEPARKNSNKNTPVKVKRRIPMKKDLIEIEKKKVVEKEEEKKRKATNVWLEAFSEAEEKWISVDVLKSQIHCIKEIYTRATHPIAYVLSWNNENHIKDLTKRYCVHWNTVTRKLRVDSKWWDETILPYKSPSNIRDREEDQELEKQQQEQPLPTTISEYKDHPLYALKRHLLKFEAIYPTDALILGFVRKEPVYSRECVHVLHSREIWLKHAKVVKPGEKPYKIVKARPKYDKLSNSIITDQPLEIFGKWQVDDYVPPTAENGVVPRNAYGNVELFKSCMLPKGTVHLQLPGLNKTARKMNVDCAPAVVGFDFHGGWSHPTFDGFVVCEEYSEQLIAAWYQEQEESEKRALEKIEKRVYDNWRRLIKGLLIRERLKAKYDFGETSSFKKKENLTLKKRKILSDNESD